MDITIEDILNEERDRVECVDSTTRGLPDTSYYLLGYARDSSCGQENKNCK